MDEHSCSRPLCTFHFLRIIHDGIYGTSRAPNCPGGFPWIGLGLWSPKWQGLHPYFLVVFFQDENELLLKSIKCSVNPISTLGDGFHSPITWAKELNHLSSFPPCTPFIIKSTWFFFPNISVPSYELYCEQYTDLLKTHNWIIWINSIMAFPIPASTTYTHFPISGFLLLYHSPTHESWNYFSPFPENGQKSTSWF